MEDFGWDKSLFKIYYTLTGLAVADRRCGERLSVWRALKGRDFDSCVCWSSALYSPSFTPTQRAAISNEFPSLTQTCTDCGSVCSWHALPGMFVELVWDQRAWAVMSKTTERICSNHRFTHTTAQTTQILLFGYLDTRKRKIIGKAETSDTKLTLVYLQVYGVINYLQDALKALLVAYKIIKTFYCLYSCFTIWITH